MVLGHSLRLVNTRKELTVLITEGVPHSFRRLLKEVYENVIVVKRLQSKDNNSAYFLNRPNLGTTYTKLHCWKLTEFSKAVFLDADIIVKFSAAPDTSWPDMFNSGVFVFKPSLTIYEDLLKLASTESSFDGGDQGLLNEYFKDWNQLTLSNHLAFAYNCSCWVLPHDLNIFYTRAPAWKKFNASVKAAHFTGIIKPWTHRMAANDGAIIHAMNMIDCAASVYTTAEQTGVLAFWWAVFFKFVKPVLSEGMVSIKDFIPFQLQFLATTWDPVLPVPPPPPTPPSSWLPAQHHAETEFWNRTENYHPEFHDTKFYDMHAGQRTDQTGTYKEYYEFQVNDSTPKEPEHHRYYQQQQQQQHHQHHYPPRHQEQPQPECHHHHNHHQHHEERQEDHWQYQETQQHPHAQTQSQGDQHWEKENYPWPTSEHAQPGGAFEQKAAPPAPEYSDEPSQCRICHPEGSVPPTDSQLPLTAAVIQEEAPAVAPEVKTPLYYAPRATCSECLREMKWSRHYIDPINRNMRPDIFPLPTRSTTRLRIRPRSIPLGLANLQYFNPISPGRNSAEGQQKVEPEKLKKPEHVLRGNSRQKGIHNKLHQVQKPRPQPVGKKRSSKTTKTKFSGESTAKDTPLKRFILEDPCTLGSEKTRPLVLKTLPDEKKTVFETQEQGSEPPKTDTTDAAGKLTGKGLPRGSSMALSDASTFATGKDLEGVSRLNYTSTKKIAEEGKSTAERKANPFAGKLSPLIEKAKPPSSTSSKADAKPVSTKDKNRIATDLPTLAVTQDAITPKKTKKNEGFRQPISPIFIFPSLDGKPPSPAVNAEKSGLEEGGLRKNESLEGQKFGTYATQESSPVGTKQTIQGMKSSRSIPQMSPVEIGHLCERHRPRPPPPEWKMYAWERGEIDYMGADRFSNILARIRSTIQENDADNLPIGTWL
ncbi:unnamed protein product [Schistocephalus solidus]|uniref:glycogenin glucosyltransferase n=1 Tax=Schistocephalus solidus TaxID=70667 RepID=A0A3P7C8W5_SCHSO|nr:unnamed protein product [Schistocephalus solidus]